MSKVSKVIVFHGFGNSENSSRIPRLKCKLFQQGIKCYTPSLPSSNKPNFQEQLDYVLKTYQYLLDENTVLIGHSLGAVLTKHFLLQSGKKIKKLILVGPAFPDRGAEHLKTSDLSKGISYIQDYVSNIVDEDEVKKLCDKYIVYLSKTDPYILFNNAQKYFSDLDVSIRVFEDKGHFSSLNGNLFEFEEILGDIC